MVILDSFNIDNQANAYFKKQSIFTNAKPHGGAKL